MVQVNCFLLMGGGGGLFVSSSFKGGGLFNRVGRRAYYNLQNASSSPLALLYSNS